MTGADVVARARSAVGHGTVYQMGGGNLDPNAVSPADAESECDCSAFVCWALKIHKFDKGLPGPRDDVWYNTDRIWADAQFIKGGRFEFLSQAEPGCVIVYPAASTVRHYRPTLALRSTGLPKVGHVGIVSTVDKGSALKVVHCSSGNFRHFTDAIQETAPAVFMSNPATVYAWCVNVDRA